MVTNRRIYLKTIQNVVKIQAFVRMTQAQRKFQVMIQKRQQAALIIQTNFKKFKAQQLLRHYKNEKACIFIQKHWRCVMARKRYLKTRTQIIILQSVIRGYLARKSYKVLLEKRIQR